MENKQLKFRAKVRKTGEASVITIPGDFIKNKIIEEGKEYEFSLTEIRITTEKQSQETDSEKKQV